MLSTKDNRKRTYRFICRKSQQLGITLSPTTADKDIDAKSLSLAELYSLKNGLADPSEQLVVSLKSILRNVATEEEINDNLILPFQSKWRSAK